jgi:hypothetical protein
MDWLYDLYKGVVPGRNRLFLQGLFGDRSKPFTEKDFTEEELLSLQQLIERADKIRPETLDQEYEQSPTTRASVENRRRRHQQGKGYVTYGDYYTGDEPDPAFTKDMLGRFNYEKSPQGVRVTDTYDFNNDGRAQRVAEYEQMSTMEKLLASLGLGEKARVKFPNAGVYQTATELGMAYMGKNGRPVNIRLPPKRK